MMSFRLSSVFALLFTGSLILLVGCGAADQDKTAVESSNTVDAQKEADGDKPVAADLLQGLQFDGIDSYVSIPNIPFDDFNKITIEAWVKDWSGRVFCQGKQGDPENSIWFSIRANQHSSGWESGKGTNASVGIVPETVDGWDHVVLSYNGQEQLIFLNGKKLYQGVAPKPGPFDPSRPLILGAQEKWKESQTKPAGLFGKGSMVLFRISNVARYKQDFEPTKTFKPDDDTVVLFDFIPSNDKTQLVDQSKHKRNGTIHDAAWVSLEDH